MLTAFLCRMASKYIAFSKAAQPLCMAMALNCRWNTVYDVALSNFSNVTIVALILAFALPPHLNWHSAATKCASNPQSVASRLHQSHLYTVLGHFYMELQNLQLTTELLANNLSLLEHLSLSIPFRIRPEYASVHLTWSLGLSLNMPIFQLVIFPSSKC